MKKEPMFFLLSFIGIVSQYPHGFFQLYTENIISTSFKKIGVFHDLGESKFQKENYVYK